MKPSEKEELKREVYAKLRADKDVILRTLRKDLQWRHTIVHKPATQEMLRKAVAWRIVEIRKIQILLGWWES